MWDPRVMSASLALGVALSLPAGALGNSEKKATEPSPKASRKASLAAADASVFGGLGAWVDNFNRRPWDNPARGVRKMARRGVTTLYVQTANYRSKKAIYRARKLSEMIEVAHRRGMKVVAWYVPAFRNLDRDLRRVKAAIRFESKSGERFDGYGMDIEATVVDSVTVRNMRTIRLSKQTRRFAGKSFPLGAIIPDPAGQLYWHPFPYAELAEIYDAFLPMGYYTYRTSGYGGVFDYTAENISIIRAESGDPDVPIHAIGGIAGRASRRDVKGFVRAVRASKAAGGSLYDYPLTEEWEWEMLAPFKKLSAPRPSK